jgi:carbamoyltransferase
MYILGISAFYHDSAAALLKDGDLVAAAQEERFSRIKFDHRFPERSVEYCLREAKITAADLDYVVFYEKPILKFERILRTNLQTFPRSWRVFRESMLAWMGEKLWTKTQLQKFMPDVPEEKLLFVEHHLSHAASAIFCSPYKDAAVLTLDGVGEWTTTGMGHAVADWETGDNNRIDLTSELRFPHSLGLLYSAFTAWLGFKVNSGEYKVMGMAPYGDPKYVDRVAKVARLFADGSFLLDMDYFSFHYSDSRTYSPKFVELFGPAREPEAEFYTDRTENVAGREAGARENQYYADVAASVQRWTEDAILAMANHLHKTTGSKNLVLAGGVALNSVANGRLMRESPFENIYIQPNAGDAGGSLGAALYAYHVMLKKPRKFVMEHSYYGESFTPSDNAAAIKAAGYTSSTIDDVNAMAAKAVEVMLDGKVIAVSQGRFEWGPRALGNRSIMADPRRAEMQEVVNTKIKFRESFRPFAPVVTEERAGEFFELGRASGQYPQRFMLMVAPIPEAKWATLPAVCHMGTGRLQTVRREWNPLYYEIIKQFGDATGVPVLMNTSFNLRGEPLVTTPAESLRTFTTSDLDMLILDNFVVRK